MKKLALLLLLSCPLWGAYSYKRTITIDHTLVGTADSTDFPVLISGTYSWLATTTNGRLTDTTNGYDMEFYSDSALTTAIPWGQERHNLTTGEVVLWVKVGTLSHTTDTVIYIAYGDATVTTDQSDGTNVCGSRLSRLSTIRQTVPL